jgi:hypothetical protein
MAMPHLQCHNGVVAFVKERIEEELSAAQHVHIKSLLMDAGNAGQISTLHVMDGLIQIQK